MRWPWSRSKPRVLNPDGGGVLVPDTAELAGDEMIDLPGGWSVRAAEMDLDADIIPDGSLSAEDIACLRMLASANFGPNATLTLPSGRVISPAEAQALTSVYAPDAEGR